jgi:Ca2+-binding RTX toxin-like protein
MSGGKDDDTQNGGGGADLIFANRGVDTTFGGDGNDVLWAMHKDDVTAPGDTVADTLDGGAGNDRFRVRDGEADRIACGDGERDRVIADQYDVIVDATPEDSTGSCEQVVRRDASTESDSGERRTESPAEDRAEG